MVKLQLDLPEAALPRHAGVVTFRLRGGLPRGVAVLGNRRLGAQLHFHTCVKDSAQAVKPDFCRCAAVKKKHISSSTISTNNFTGSHCHPLPLTVFLLEISFSYSSFCEERYRSHVTIYTCLRRYMLRLSFLHWSCVVLCHISVILLFRVVRAVCVIAMRGL